MWEIWTDHQKLKIESPNPITHPSIHTFLIIFETKRMIISVRKTNYTDFTILCSPVKRFMGAVHTALIPYTITWPPYCKDLQITLTRAMFASSYRDQSFNTLRGVKCIKLTDRRSLQTYVKKDNPDETMYGARVFSDGIKILGIWFLIHPDNCTYVFCLKCL